MTSKTAERAFDVGRALDGGPWSAYQKWLVGLTALTIIFDGIDNQMLGIAIPTLMGDWSVGRCALAPGVAPSLAGMMVGVAGRVRAGDARGRPPPVPARSTPS